MSPHFTGRVQSASKMDCSHYECVMNKQCVIEKLYFMLGRLVNEGLCVVKREDCVPLCCGVLVCVVGGNDGISCIADCRVILYFCGILDGLLLHINRLKIRKGSAAECTGPILQCGPHKSGSNLQLFVFCCSHDATLFFFSWNFPTSKIQCHRTDM